MDQGISNQISQDQPASTTLNLSKAMLTKPLLTVHEVAELLKISDDTVREWIHDRSLRAIKFGREWRIVVRDLESFLIARANRPETDG